MAESGFEPTGVRLQSLALSWPPVRAGFGFDGFHPLEGLNLFGTFLVFGVCLFVCLFLSNFMGLQSKHAHRYELCWHSLPQSETGGPSLGLGNRTLCFQRF